MSKSGLFEILKVKLAKSKFDSGEIEIRIPKFQNFGFGLAKRERQADEYEKKLEAERSPEEIAQAEAESDKLAADLIKTMRASAAESKKELDSLPANQKKAMKLVAKMWEDCAAMLENDSEDDTATEEITAKPLPKPEDFETLTVMLGDKVKWDGHAEERLDKFIQSWPEVRPRLLKKAHAYYKKSYPELKRIFGDMASFPYLMPNPISSQPTEDLFSIGMIYLRDDGAIGLSGSCTWDDEHGFGTVISNGKVIVFGHADEGFAEG